MPPRGGRTRSNPAPSDPDEEAPRAGRLIRIDPKDGRPYTRKEFIERYGGTEEWEAARPVTRSRRAEEEEEEKEKGGGRGAPEMCTPQPEDPKAEPEPLLAFRDPVDDVEVVFFSGEKGMYYRTPDGDRPTFTEALFAIDKLGPYIEFQEIDRILSLPADRLLIPDLLRLFERCGVRHNLSTGSEATEGVNGASQSQPNHFELEEVECSNRQDGEDTERVVERMKEVRDAVQQPAGADLTYERKLPRVGCEVRFKNRVEFTKDLVLQPGDVGVVTQSPAGESWTVEVKTQDTWFVVSVDDLEDTWSGGRGHGPKAACSNVWRLGARVQLLGEQQVYGTIEEIRGRRMRVVEEEKNEARWVEVGEVKLAPLSRGKAAALAFEKELASQYFWRKEGAALKKPPATQRHTQPPKEHLKRATPTASPPNHAPPPTEKVAMKLCPPQEEPHRSGKGKGKGRTAGKGAKGVPVKVKVRTVG